MQRAVGARLDAQQLARARQAQAADGSLARVAAELGFANEEDALRAVGETLNLELIDLTTEAIDLRSCSPHSRSS